MIRFLLRFIGLCILAMAFVLFVYDGTKTIANQHVVYAKLVEVWAMVDQSSLNQAQAWLKQKAPGPGTRICKRSSTCRPGACSAIIAMILIVLGRKKKPLIGYARN